MARASTPTLLALDRYSRILGANPVHFNGGDGNSIDIFPINDTCDDFWPQYAWQLSDRVSRELLARAIYDAEQDIARELKYYPAPYWIYQEAHMFPRHYRPDTISSGGYNVRGFRKSVQLRYGKFIEPGQRAVSAVQLDATVSYSDPDGDGFNELATITANTTLTDVCEIKVYFADKSGVQEWEIRPERSKSISGGVVTFTFDSWLLFDPDLWERYPGGDNATIKFESIDINVAGNYVTTVDVYREYNDTTATSATFYWEPEPRTVATSSGCCSGCSGQDCPACSLSTQNGCIHSRDVENGIVAPVPATYDADNGQWSSDAYSVCRDPDQVKCSYYAGDLDNRWLGSEKCEPLSDYWAHAIAWLATARLPKPPCSCNNVRAIYDWLQEDLSLLARDKSYQLDLNLLANPFGRRRGEIMAWERVAKIQRRRLGAAIL